MPVTDPSPAAPRGDVPELVFLHGFGADRLSWAATTPDMGDYPVHTPDLPGHGRADHDIGDGTPETLAERMTTAIAELSAGPVHLVGHSLGGSLALLIARERPDLVASLFLIAPAGLGTGLDPDFLHAFPTLAEEDTATELLRRLVVKPKLISAQTVGYTLSQLDRTEARESLTRIAQGLIGGHARLAEAADAVAHTDVPRHVVWGAEDGINPRDEARLAGFGSHDILPAVAHLPHIEAPEEVNARLQVFVEGHSKERDPAN